jgi:alpha-ketoglutarate-dependent taurine dioxygenase
MLHGRNEVGGVRAIDFRDVRSGRADARSVLAEGGGALTVRDFPTEDNAELIAFASQFGDLTAPGRLHDHPMEDDVVYRVEVVGDGLRTDDGSIVHSTAAARFPCHTDGFGSRSPPAVVLLLCVRPDRTGGRSLLTRVDEVVARLEAADVERLLTPAFFNGIEQVSLLNRRQGEGWTARFNLADLKYCDERAGEFAVDRASLDAAQRFGEISEALGEASSFRLRHGDCLVLDNSVMLHGRTAVSKTSRRLLKRVRAYERRPS